MAVLSLLLLSLALVAHAEHQQDEPNGESSTLFGPWSAVQRESNNIIQQLRDDPINSAMKAETIDAITNILGTDPQHQTDEPKQPFGHHGSASGACPSRGRCHIRVGCVRVGAPQVSSMGGTLL